MGANLSSLKTIKLLLVDDDNFALRIVRHIITGLGIEQFKEAFNGEEAKSLLDKHRFDLVITDIEMPKMNGLELIKKIRCGSTGVPRDTRVIAVTNLANSEVAKASVTLDVNGFLAKPMKPVIVAEKIKKALAEKVLIRPESIYESVITDLRSLRSGSKPSTSKQTVETSPTTPPTQPIQKPQTSETTKTDKQNLVSIMEIKPGMCVSENVYLKDGTLLISAGFILSETTVNRLIDMHKVLKEEFISINPEEGK